MRNPKKIALDTNIFVYYFNLHPQFGLSSKKIFDKLTKDKLHAVTSITTLIEILSLKNLADQDSKEIASKLSSIPNLTILDLNQEIAFKAAEIRRKYGFKTPDATQIATAIHAKAKIFVTNDQRLKSFKQIKVVMISEIK